MSHDIHAHAFTHGRDIFFNRGRFDPESISGQHLLAHELTHTIQQGGRNQIQRLEIGHGAIPHGNTTWQEVPEEHEPRAEAANDIIEEAAENPRLVNYFRDNAPGGTNTTLQEVLDRARVWEIKETGPLGESYEGERDMAYDPYVYRIGRYMMASTLLHEMGHLASFPTEEQCENTTETARVYTPFIERIRPRSAAPGTRVTIRGMNFGFSQTPVDKIFFNGTDAGNAESWNWTHEDQSTAVINVPAEASSGPVWVENNRVKSNEVPFTVV
jgi:hypothetical protein